MATNIKSDLMTASNLYYLAALFFILLSLPVQGQKPSVKTADVSRLKLKFKETFSRDFDILNDEVRKKGEQEFWLVTVRSKIAGIFVFRYKFQHLKTGYFNVKDNTYHVYSDKEHHLAVKAGYRYYDNEYHIFVGEKGCQRTLGYNLSRPPQPGICIEDAVVIPIRIGNGFIKHSFSNVSRYSSEIRTPRSKIDDKALDTQPVENLAEAHLKYIGQIERYITLRNLDYRATFHAVFEATHPGKFNLQLSAQAINKTKPDNKGNASRNEGTPIIVVPQQNPITILASSEQTEETEDGYLSSSSYGVNDYFVKTLVLRPRDRVSVEYLTFIVPKTAERQSIEVKPVIEKRSFSNVQADNRNWYDDWLLQPTVP